MVLVREKSRRNLDGNKKNIGKRTKQKRRPGGAGEGSAGEKAEQGIAGQTEPGCRGAAEDDGESGGEIMNEIKKWNKKDRTDKKPALDFDSTGEYDIYINIGSRANGLSLKR